MSQVENPVELRAELEDSKPEPDEVKKLKSRDLIKASEALNILQHYVGGRPAAKKLLIDLISDREINAYARYHWTTDKKGIKATWKSGPPEDAIERKKIKAGVFAGSSVLDEDRKKWRWKRNRFHVTHVKRDGMILRYFYLGVRFEKKAIEQLLVQAKTVMRDIYKGGRNYEGDRWTEFWVQVVLLAREGKLDDPNITAGAISKLVIDAYHNSGPEKPLSDSAIAKSLLRVRKVMKAADNGTNITEQQPNQSR